MPAEKPLVYLVLGVAGSGRRELLADLIDGGLAEGDNALVLLAEAEKPDERDAQLGRIARWSWEGSLIASPPEVLEGASHVFFVTDGAGNPVDQIEAFKPWLESHGGELGQVLCVVDCLLTSQHREMVAWYDACIHFSDIVLLARREGVPNKWLSDFQHRFKSQFYPCLFEFVKSGRVKNPALLLDPQPRRMSHYFDEPDWLVNGADAEDDFAMGEGDGDEHQDLDEEVEVVEAQDPYFERRAGGRRMKEIPDIARFLAR